MRFGGFWGNLINLVKFGEFWGNLVGLRCFLGGLEVTLGKAKMAASQDGCCGCGNKNKMAASQDGRCGCGDK